MRALRRAVKKGREKIGELYKLLAIPLSNVVSTSSAAVLLCCKVEGRAVIVIESFEINYFLAKPNEIRHYHDSTLYRHPSVLIMTALRSRCGHYIFVLFLSIFFPSPNLSRRRLDVCHTSTHAWCGPSANLECRSEMCCARLAGNAGLQKNRQKVAIWAPSHDFVGLYLRN